MKGRRLMSVPDGATARVLAAAPSELEGLCARIDRRFRRPEVRQRVRRYLAALFAPLARKNGWQIAEQLGERSPDGVQELLNAARWDADAVREDLQAYVVEHLGAPEGVLAVDETGFVKKGSQSVGVARQYTGTTGQVENCQVGVFLTYATEQGRTFLDRELYLPQEWADDPERRQQAGVPETLQFATKPQLAQRMLARVLAAGVPASWVTGDAVYGRDVALRRWLEAQQQPYVLGVGKDERVCPDCEWLPVKSGRVDQIAARLPALAWQRRSCGAGTKGPRLYDWAWIPLWQDHQTGWRRWLLVRRSINEPGTLAYYRVFSQETTDLAEVLRATGCRWSVEETFETGKGLVGLDQYEVRKWDAWYRYITLAALAHAFLCVLRARGAGGEPPESQPLESEPSEREPLPRGKGGIPSPRPPAAQEGPRRIALTPDGAGGPSPGPPAGLRFTDRARARRPLVRLATPTPGARPTLSLPSPSQAALP